MYLDRRNSQNIVHLLQNRESGFVYNPYRCCHLSYERDFYKCINPRLTIENVELPPIYIRKFTPDGSKLVAFTHDQRSLHVYDYLGLSTAGPLMQEANLGTAETYDANDTLIGEDLFDTLFDTRFVIRLCQGDQVRNHLHREFSIFLDNGRYVLVASMSVNVLGGLEPSFFVRYPDLFDKLDVFGYVFFLVDLVENRVSDEITFAHDAICMSHNHGVSLHRNTLAILSRLYQCVYLFELVDGRLIKQETIGLRPREVSLAHLWEVEDMNLDTKFPITHIKQRILTFLYKRIMDNNQLTREQRRAELKEFYKNFEFMEHMIIEKMQLANSDVLLLRYEQRPLTSLDVLQPESPPKRLYVFYAITAEKVLGVYEDDSVDFLNLILLYSDTLCQTRSLQTGEGPSSPTHYFIYQNFINPTKPTDILRQAALRFNPSVPVSTQSFAVTPFLNFNRFIYDDRQISPLERPKLWTSNDPIMFFDRGSDLVKFRMYTKGRSNARETQNRRELYAFVFHPYEPFVLSIQKLMHTYSFNIHLYNHSTVVQPQTK